MNKIDFTITLTSDGEPGSGFATDLIDSLLPRDINDQIFLYSTHLKGIIRENLENMPREAVPLEVIDTLFGKPGAKTQGSLFHIGDAMATGNAKTIEITRTRVNEFGVADPGALRTSEAVAAGTKFKGTLTTHTHLSKTYEDIIRLGFLSLFAVGGGRNRGAGACITNLGDEKRMPGQILRELVKVDFSQIPETKSPGKLNVEISDKQVTLKLIFKANNPVCAPEIPVVGNNLIRSGFAIPASAVQGAILHRITDISKDVADKCYQNPDFRAWPLHPVDNDYSLSLRVSFTHKISKSKINETDHYFADDTIQKYHWDEVPGNSPLVHADGVLLTNGDKIQLWRASDMARIITAHGVHNGDRGADQGTQKRNLFVVESMSPMLFSGIVTMPQTAANLLQESLGKNSFVQLGKSRSVRGGGQLCAQSVAFDDISGIKNHGNSVFIVQSPVLVPQNFIGLPVEEIISKLAAGAGFGEIETAKGSMSTQFGWNNNQNGRTRARAVIAPGAVFKVISPVENPGQKLITGVGNGRKNGFGAVLPHPGLAQQLFPVEPALRVVPKAVKNYGIDGFKLGKQAKSSGLSTSQVSRILELTALNPDKAVSYLNRQQTDRPVAVWNRWKGIIPQIKSGIQDDPHYMIKVLKICRDLLAVDDTEGN